MAWPNEIDVFEKFDVFKHHFLQNQLNIDVFEWQQKTKYDQISEICDRFEHTIPFQNLSILAKKPSDRYLPTIDDIINEIRSGMGGMGFARNIFVYYLLRSLNFEADLLAGRAALAGGTIGSHAMVLVHHLTFTDSRHLIDVGTGLPGLPPTSMDFLQKSTTVENAIMSCWFCKLYDDDECEAAEHNTIERWQSIAKLTGHAEDDDIVHDAASEVARMNGRIKLFVQFSLKPKTVDYFLPKLRETFYGEKPSSKLMQFTYASMLQHGRLMRFVGCEYLEQREDDIVVRQAIGDPELLAKFIKLKMPSISVEVIAKAVDNMWPTMKISRWDI